MAGGRKKLDQTCIGNELTKRCYGCVFREHNRKKPRRNGAFYVLQPHYFFPPLTLAITKIISAMKATTKKMPHTIPALKIPDTTEQLVNPKAKKETIEENNLIRFLCSVSNRIPFLYSNEINRKLNAKVQQMGNEFYKSTIRLRPLPI